MRTRLGKPGEPGRKDPIPGADADPKEKVPSREYSGSKHTGQKRSDELIRLKPISKVKKRNSYELNRLRIK